MTDLPDEWFKPLEKDDVYFRPFVFDGNPLDIPKRESIFLVGINPATKITTKNKSLDEIKRLLCDRKELNSFLEKERGKVSKTRKEIGKLVELIGTNIKVIETDVCAYPTKDLRELKNFRKNQEYKNRIERGIKIFKELLISVQPKIIIVYGKYAIKELRKEYRIEGLEKKFSIKADKSSAKDRVYKMHLIDCGYKVSIILAPHFSRNQISERDIKYIAEKIKDMWAKGTG
ncbi:MAG: hypothetical protein PHO02_00920 [Candidatus Nanoarchaeia archaeon]|nr:hypothetical protein [Candidatus Nanoarchaeia archaeon]